MQHCGKISATLWKKYLQKTTEDTHWNVNNMIYGDNPQKINERKDPLGLNIYTYVPDINAIRQSTNLYVYCGNNPIMYMDSNGEIFMLVTGAIGAVVGGISGAIYSQVKYGEVSWQNVAAGAAIGGAIGLTGGAATAYLVAGSATASTGAVMTGLGIAGAGAAGGGATYATSKFIENSQILYNSTVKHIFSKPHVTDGIMRLGSDKVNIFNKLVNTINQYSSKFVSGSNEIRTVVNGVDTTIRFYVVKGKIINIDAFVGYSNHVFGTLLKK